MLHVIIMSVFFHSCWWDPSFVIFFLLPLPYGCLFSTFFCPISFLRTTFSSYQTVWKNGHVLGGPFYFLIASAKKTKKYLSSTLLLATDCQSLFPFKFDVPQSSPKRLSAGKDQDVCHSSSYTKCGYSGYTSRGGFRVLDGNKLPFLFNFMVWLSLFFWQFLLVHSDLDDDRGNSSAGKRRRVHLRHSGLPRGRPHLRYDRGQRGLDDHQHERGQGGVSGKFRAVATSRVAESHPTAGHSNSVT